MLDYSIHKIFRDINSTYFISNVIDRKVEGARSLSFCNGLGLVCFY